MDRVFQCFLRSLLLTLMLSIHGVSGAAPAGAPPGRGTEDTPCVFLEDTVYDFGETSEDGEVSHDFKISNRGSAELRIMQVMEG